MATNTIGTPKWLGWHNVCIESHTRLNIRVREYPGTSDLWHGHRDFGELVVVVGGSACNESENRHERLSAGDVQVLPPGAVHRYSSIHAFRHFTILWQQGVLHDLPDGLRMFPNYAKLFDTNRRPSPILHIDPAKMTDTVEALEAMRTEYLAREVGWTAAVYINFCRALLHILRYTGCSAPGGSETSFQIGRTIRLMEENPFRNFSLQSLSTFAQMSESSFRHHFQQLTGFPPIEYLIRLKLQRAASLVAHTDWPISEIAIQTGFTDGSYFARQFRTVFKMTAKEFRNACRSGKVNLTEALKILQLPKS